MSSDLSVFRKSSSLKGCFAGPIQGRTTRTLAYYG